MLIIAALAGLLSMGLSLSREAERLASLANGMKIGTIREQSASPPEASAVRGHAVESVKAIRASRSRRFRFRPHGGFP